VRHLRILWLSALALLVAVTIACGDDDEVDTSGSEETSPAATREDSESPATTDAAGATDGPTGAATGLDDEVQVEAADFSFSPDTFILPSGVPVKIEVRNAGGLPHTLTVYSDPEYSSAVSGADTGNIEAGEDASIETTFDPGEYFFRCEIHPTQMEGDFAAE
jgi:plastocyanin